MEPFVKVTFFTSSPAIVNYLTALALATLTIMIAGVPAAISERMRGLKQSDAMSYYIWLGGVILLAMPSLFNSPSAESESGKDSIKVRVHHFATFPP